MCDFIICIDIREKCDVVHHLILIIMFFAHKLNIVKHLEGKNIYGEGISIDARAIGRVPRKRQIEMK